MKNKKFIFSIASVVLLNALALAGWFYLFSVLKNQSGVTKEIQEKIATNEKEINENKLLKSLAGDITEKKKKIDSVFLGKQDMIKFIEEFEALADKTGVSIKFGGVNFEGLNAGTPYLQFSVKGGFSQVFHYFVLQENLPYSIKINKADFHKSGEKEWQANFEIILISFKDI